MSARYEFRFFDLRLRNGMRLIRFRLRTLMLFVALVAVILEVGHLIRLSDRYTRRANYYAILEKQCIPLRQSNEAEQQFFANCIYDWASGQKRKYEHAARHPWQSVAADPIDPLEYSNREFKKSQELNRSSLSP